MMSQKIPPIETIQKVADECERLSVNMLSSYQMARALLQDIDQKTDGVYYADILSQFLRSAARDLEDIVEALTGVRTGFHECEFGTVLEEKRINHAQ